MSGDLYLIWSNQHRAWWRPNSMGYTVHVAAAGRYDRSEAISICAGGWDCDRAPDEVMVLESDVAAIETYRPPQYTPQRDAGDECGCRECKAAA